MATNPYYDWSTASRFVKFDTVRAADVNAALDLVTTGFDGVSSVLAGLTDGSAIGIPYVFSTTTTDADPGAGYLRLDNATQTSATTIRADLSGSDGAVWGDVLATFDDSTSTVKGFILLQAVADASKWLIFSLASMASPAGYKNFTVTNVAGSAASPFANNDAIVMKFSRTGDKGETGAAATLSQTMVERTSNTVITNADKSKLIKASGTWTQTFAAVSTVDADFFIDYENAGTGTVTHDPDGAEQIDGLTTLLQYRSEIRRIRKNAAGTAWETAVLRSFVLEDGTTAAGTFIAPAGYAEIIVEQQGAGSGGNGGGGGASGRTNSATGTGGGAGSGGAAGACGSKVRRVLPASKLPAGTSVGYQNGTGGTGGAGGAGGAGSAGGGGNNGVDGSFGLVGTASTFGSASDFYYISATPGPANTDVASQGQGGLLAATGGPATTNTTTQVSATVLDLGGVATATRIGGLTTQPTAAATTTGGTGTAGGTSSTSPESVTTTAGGTAGTGSSALATNGNNGGIPAQAAAGQGGAGGGGGGGSYGGVAAGTSGNGGTGGTGGQGGNGYTRITGKI